MTARNYDVIVQFSNSTPESYSNYPAITGQFETGNVVIGSGSGATGTIANVDLSANTMKVKYSNSYQVFALSDNIKSTATLPLIHNSSYTYSDANSDAAATVNSGSIAVFNAQLPDIRIAARVGPSTNVLVLPTNANANSEISIYVNNVQLHSSQYQWAQELQPNVQGTISEYVTIGGSNTFTNVVELGQNAVFLHSSILFSTSDRVDVRIDSGNLKSTTFTAANTDFSSSITTALSTQPIALKNSPFIAEKNAFTQNPIVRLISIYYPGEHYPPNKYGNPSLTGEGRSWPNDFPFRLAEINGDIISDISYNVTYDGDSYSPYPLEISAIEQASDGKINDLTVNIFNFENTISALIEDPFIAGNNKSNSAMALVNGVYVNGIDPRTINMEADEISNWVGFPNFASSGGYTANLAANVLFGLRAKTWVIPGTSPPETENVFLYSATVTGAYGTENASWTYNEVVTANGSSSADWQDEKPDSRDLLGAVIEIKTTFANFLDYWPEYSTIQTIFGNTYEMVSTMPYRVGDNVKSSKGTTEATIESIEENQFLFLSNPLDTTTAITDPIYIINVDADPDSFIEDVFKIDSMDAMNDTTVSFSLASWLQYFKLVIPKRKFYKNTCGWQYKGAECQYPGPGDGTYGLPIPGTTNLGNPNPVAANNIASSSMPDVCGKSLASCQIRNNGAHFGGFPATGRTIPRM